MTVGGRLTYVGHRATGWRVAIGVMSTAVVAAACGGDDLPTLGGAERVAQGGDTPWSEVRDTLQADDPDEQVHLDDVTLQDAALVMHGPDNESMAVLIDEYGMEDRLLTASASDGAIQTQGIASVSMLSTQTAADITPAGVLVSAADGDADRTFGDPGRVGESSPDGDKIGIYEPGYTPRAEYPSPFLVGALDLADDGSVLAGGMDEGRIARIDLDGTTTQLLGPAGGDARVTMDGSVGPVVSVLALDDGRAAFVAGTDGDTRLYVLDDASVRELPSGGEDASPVARTDERHGLDEDDPYPRAAITPIAPSPDGRVLTTGIGPAGDPQIALVDVDTGDTEVLAVLEGVEPSVDDPVSAAIVGDDLIFLAQHQLWRMPDVIDVSES